MANGRNAASTATAEPAPEPAEVKRRDLRHTLHASEVQRVFAEGGSIVHAGEIITKAEDLPDEVKGGEAFSEDSPMHPKKVAERRERRRLRAIQDGTLAPTPNPAQASTPTPEGEDEDEYEEPLGEESETKRES